MALPAITSPSFSRPAWAEINLSSLRANARLLSGARDTRLIAVIKANAYGHGAIEVARALQNDVLFFAVASVDEGRILRDAGIAQPILLLSAILPDEAEAALASDLMPTLSNLEVAQVLNDTAKKHGQIASAHWKIDTGMGRVGTFAPNAVSTWRALQQYPHLDIKGVYTHFACADEESDDFTLGQIAAFEKVLGECGISQSNQLIHAANSAGTLRFPQAHFGAIRSGIALYGASPFGSAQRDDRFLPIMSLHARVTEVREIAAGRTVSYGASWTARRDSRIALIPLGYADGYSRRLSNHGEVLIRGKRCPVVGRVTMDQILVDATELSSNLQPGEIVTAWGHDENGVFLPVEEVADKVGTIAYELLCGVAPRIPRIYRD